MTIRPAQRAVSRRQAVVYSKAVRALAHKECTTMHNALSKLDGYRTCREERYGRTNDGFSYVSHIQVDDGMLHLDDEDVYDFKVDFSTHEEPRRQTNMTVSLIDIAKPARRKVRAKKSAMIIQDREIYDYEFEDFIELDYSDTFSVFSEDWEDICAGDDVRLDKR